MNIDRRSLLAAGAAAALPLPALAKAPLAGPVNPAYRFKVGDYEVTAISDGYIDLDVALFPKSTPDEAGKLLAKAFREKTGKLRSSVNAFVVNTGDTLVLIDSGTGAVMGPSLGHVPARLKAAGIEPDAIDVVLWTHMHPDHVNGMTDASGAPLYRNAQVLVRDEELKFWTDEGIASRAPAEAQPFFKLASNAAKAYAKSTKPFGKDVELVTGITPVYLPGHTVGHTGYRITSGKDTLLIWGDIVHAPSLQFARPDWSIAFDTDQALAADSRRKILDQVATDKVLVAGMHLDFPALGYVVKAGDGYDYVPARWALDL